MQKIFPIRYCAPPPPFIPYKIYIVQTYCLVLHLLVPHRTRSYSPTSLSRSTSGARRNRSGRYVKPCLGVGGADMICGPSGSFRSGRLCTETSLREARLLTSAAGPLCGLSTGSPCRARDVDGVSTVAAFLQPHTEAVLFFRTTFLNGAQTYGKAVENHDGRTLSQSQLMQCKLTTQAKAQTCTYIEVYLLTLRAVFFTLIEYSSF